jgi:hypothetical protein
VLAGSMEVQHREPQVAELGPSRASVKLGKMEDHDREPPLPSRLAPYCTIYSSCSSRPDAENRSTLSPAADPSHKI